MCMKGNCQEWWFKSGKQCCEINIVKPAATWKNLILIQKAGFLTTTCWPRGAFCLFLRFSVRKASIPYKVQELHSKGSKWDCGLPIPPLKCNLMCPTQNRVMEMVPHTKLHSKSRWPHYLPLSLSSPRKGVSGRCSASGCCVVLFSHSSRSERD